MHRMYPHFPQGMALHGCTKLCLHRTIAKAKVKSLENSFKYFLFDVFFLVGHIHMSYLGPLTPLFWISGEWVLPFLHWGGGCNVHSLFDVYTKRLAIVLFVR